LTASSRGEHLSFAVGLKSLRLNLCLFLDIFTSSADKSLFSIELEFKDTFHKLVFQSLNFFMEN
jgi:hypothetical protein